MRVLLALALMASPAAAQDLIFSPQATQACLASTQSYDARHACIGASAERCISDTPGGDSTYGMSGCLSAELDYWDARLNAAYAEVIGSARAMDADMAEIGATVASQEEALRAMQRAWITFRDARCAYEASTWGGGTGAGPATADCLMEETARQTLTLLRQVGLQ